MHMRMRMLQHAVPLCRILTACRYACVQGTGFQSPFAAAIQGPASDLLNMTACTVSSATIAVCRAPSGGGANHSIFVTAGAGASGGSFNGTNATAPRCEGFAQICANSRALGSVGWRAMA
jgi:hypothetical protein